MAISSFSRLDLQRLPSPCFVVDEVAIEHNLRLLQTVAQASGARVLAALKAFSMWRLGPLTARYLDGTCASGLHEARLGFEEYRHQDKPAEVHVFSAAFSDADLVELLGFADHIVFNSCAQWQRFQPRIQSALAARPSLRFGLRINPEHSEGSVPLYDPCAPGSRLGIIRSQLDESVLKGISGLHFHTLCEQDFKPLERTLAAVEQQFGDLLPQMSWVNFGGGHHITRPGYQIDELIRCIRQFSEKYAVQVYLEPGEAIALGAGILSCEVLDLIHNEVDHAILDVSATCHMPDTLEMPYRPDVTGAGAADDKPYRYRLGGLTCLAGDVINEYSFDHPLRIGQRLVFEDMAHYTMVKTTTFNGTRLPAIALWNSQTDKLEIVRQFSYSDFRTRLS